MKKLTLRYRAESTMSFSYSNVSRQIAEYTRKHDRKGPQVALNLRDLMFYTPLEPKITITPQYPDRLRKKLDPAWESDLLMHPLLGMDEMQDADIKSRYLNLDNPFSPPFLPSHTTFHLYANCKGINAAHVAFFFKHDERNRFGVRFVEFLVDDYQGAKDVLEPLNQFPRLEKVKITLRFDHETWDWRAYLKDKSIKTMKDDLARFIRKSDCWKGVPKAMRPMWMVDVEKNSCITKGCNAAPCNGEHACRDYGGMCERARYHGARHWDEPLFDEHASLEEEFQNESLWTKG